MLCTLVSCFSAGMIAIIAIISATKPPAVSRPATASRPATNSNTRQADRAHQLHQRRGNAARGLDLQRQPEMVVGQRAVALMFDLLRAVDLHFLVIVQRLVRGLHQLRAAFLDACG